MPPIDSADTGVSESDVLALFDKDGDLRDEPQGAEEDSADEGSEDQEDQEEEETEAEEEAEEEEGDDDSGESEDEESEDDEEEEPKSQIDWSKASPEHRAAFEASQKEVGKLRKDYGKLHSKFAELSQSRREEEQSLEGLRAGAQMAHQWNEILEQHPELQNQILALIQKAQNPDSEIPEELKEDPAVQFMLRQNQQLKSEIRKLSEGQQPLKTWEAQQRQAEVKGKLDGILGEAREKFKGMFKKDMTEEQLTNVLQYIVQNQAYGNPKNGHKGAGIAAVLDVFGAEYEKSLSTQTANRLREKAKKFGGRNRTVNSRQAASAPKISSEGDAIKQALADQGMNV